MPDRITKLQRWLDLISFLVGRRLPVSAEEIMERIPAYAAKWVEGNETDRATARRTFERDKDELRKLGIPIETVVYRLNYEQVEGYRLLRRDFYLPYLKLVREAGADRGGSRPYLLEEVELTEAEAGAALEALRSVVELPAFPFAREARSAFRKLAFDLDLDAFRTAPVLYVDRPGAEELLERLRPVSDALLARKRIRFRYHGIHRGEATQREVRPYGLFFQRGHWYLVAYDLGRADIRVFRVARMEGIEPNLSSPHTPDYEIPGDFRVERYLEREAWELGDEEALGAEVLFRFPLSLWAERNGYGELVEERPDGGSVRRFEVHQVSPFLRWVLSLEGEAEVLSPPELAAGLVEMAREVAALYGEVG